MARSEATRVLLEHRYRTELPFPMSAAFYHYSGSPTKDSGLRATRLVVAAEDALRYAAILAVCDYATDPDADQVAQQKVLKWVRRRWPEGKPLGLGDWPAVLQKLLAQFGKTWRNAFVRESDYLFDVRNLRRRTASV